MSRRARHSLGTQLSGAALGRVLSVDQAASLLGVDRNSIRRWMKEHGAADDWHIIERMAGAQLVERVARGLVKSSRDLATIKGIAGRNVRVRELIARRETRRSDETCDCILPPGWVPELHPKAGTPEHASAVWAIAASKMTEWAELEAKLAAVVTLQSSTEVIAQYAPIHAAVSEQLRGKGHNDIWVAATALAQPRPPPILTGNMADFAKIAAVAPIQLVGPEA